MNEILRRVDMVRSIALSMWRWAMQKHQSAAAEKPDWLWGRGYYEGLTQAYGLMLKEMRRTRRSLVLCIEKDNEQDRAADAVAAAEARMEDR